MARCAFCDYDNASSAKRCGSCGAELTVEREPGRPPTQEPLPQREPPSDSLAQDVLSLMRRGKKIDAIKLYRQKKGGGLAEAKGAVEALALQHGIQPTASGCATVLLLSAMIAAAITSWLAM